MESKFSGRRKRTLGIAIDKLRSGLRDGVRERPFPTGEGRELAANCVASPTPPLGPPASPSTRGGEEK